MDSICLVRKELNKATNFSVPDQFGARVGMTYALFPKSNIAVSLGGRLEGLPAVDVIGGSAGSRRPGYIVSVEPGIIWSGHKSLFLVVVPYAVVRDRIPTWTVTGFREGDAAFADYLISVTYAFVFKVFLQRMWLKLLFYKGINYILQKIFS